MSTFNWFGVFFSFGIPAGVIVAMIAMLIHDHRKAKRRSRRCHRKIEYWWERKVG